MQPTTIQPAPLTPFDWVQVIEKKRDSATGGPFAGEWGPYWQKDLEELGSSPVGIVATTLCAERVTPEMAEKGIDGDEWAEHELVALLAWHEDGEELPRFEENIDYICELHNRFPQLVSELYNQRNRAALAEYKLAKLLTHASNGAPHCVNLVTVKAVLAETRLPIATAPGCASACRNCDQGQEGGCRA